MEDEWVLRTNAEELRRIGGESGRCSLEWDVDDFAGERTEGEIIGGWGMVVVIYSEAVVGREFHGHLLRIRSKETTAICRVCSWRVRGIVCLHSQPNVIQMRGKVPEGWHP